MVMPVNLFFSRNFDPDRFGLAVPSATRVGVSFFVALGSIIGKPPAFGEFFGVVLFD